MEPITAFPINGEWDSFGRMLSSEELDFTLQSLGDQYSFPALEPGMNIGTPSFFCPNNPEADVNEFYSLDTLNSNFHYISQENSYSNGAHENYCLSDSDHIPVTNEYCSFSTDGLDGLNGGQGAATAALGKEVQLKRKFDTLELATATEDKTNAMSSENSKKKLRGSRNGEQKSKKNVQSKNKWKHTSNGNDVDEIGNGGSQSTSSYSSEDDNASQELVKGENSISKTSGKTRASRGSATDPQSLYAKKRRERINERLRILQNLVPSGTKVDLSTMLEEAVHYVKFLQLQIKLLSSDEMWMYAPIAYNGVDIGLHGKISTAL